MKGRGLQSGLVALLIFVSSGIARASAPNGGGPLGVGFILGAPTGVSLKYWTGRDTAWDAAVAVRSSDLQLHADHLWHPEWFKVETGQMPLYLGVGGRVHFKNDDSVVGVRLVGGVAYHFPDNPLDVFVEIVPSIRLTPSVGGDMDAAVGVRYYFRTQGAGRR